MPKIPAGKTGTSKTMGAGGGGKVPMPTSKAPKGGKPPPKSKKPY